MQLRELSQRLYRKRHACRHKPTASEEFRGPVLQLEVNRRTLQRVRRISFERSRRSNPMEHRMHYSDEEIERAKTLFARENDQPGHGRMAVAAMAGMSKPGKISHITHRRTWRDYLSKARRDLQKERSDWNFRLGNVSHDLN